MSCQMLFRVCAQVALYTYIAVGKTAINLYDIIDIKLHPTLLFSDKTAACLMPLQMR